MAEELVLTDPVVVPEKVTDKYKLASLLLDVTAFIDPVVPGAVVINVIDNHNVRSTFTYSGDDAMDYIKWMNTANFTTKSMQKRILEKLSSDGHLPGTVQGTPDPPAKSKR